MKIRSKRRNEKRVVVYCNRKEVFLMEPGLNIVEIKQTDAEAFLSYFPQGYTGISMEEGFIGFGLYNGELTAGALLAQNDEAAKTCGLL